MIILFKYCADVENCESFKGFGFIYDESRKIIKVVHWYGQPCIINKPKDITAQAHSTH